MERCISYCRNFILVLFVIMVLGACSSNDEPTVTSQAVDDSPIIEEGSNDDFPNKPIQFIVASSPGGGHDTTSRQVLPYFEKAIGGQTVVNNHPGGSTAVGTTLVVEREVDGYTMMVTGTPHLNFSHLSNPDVTYTSSDLAALGALSFEAGVIRVRDEAPWNDLSELIEYARTQPPGALTASVGQLASNNYVALKQIEEATGVEFTIVPFNGGSDARLALLSGEVDFTHAGAYNSLDIEDGTRVIAVQQPSNDWPDVTDNAKTVNEQLGTDVPDSSTTVGFFVNRGVKDNYPERYQKMVDALEIAFNDPEFKEKMEAIGEWDKFKYIEPEEYDQMISELDSQLAVMTEIFEEE